MNILFSLIKRWKLVGIMLALLVGSNVILPGSAFNLLVLQETQEQRIAQKVIDDYKKELERLKKVPPVPDEVLEVTAEVAEKTTYQVIKREVQFWVTSIIIPLLAIAGFLKEKNGRVTLLKEMASFPTVKKVMTKKGQE